MAWTPSGCEMIHATVSFWFSNTLARLTGDSVSILACCWALEDGCPSGRLVSGILAEASNTKMREIQRLPVRIPLARFSGLVDNANLSIASSNNSGA